MDSSWTMMTTKAEHRQQCPSTDSDVVIWMRDWLHPLLVALAKSKIKYDIEPLNNFHALPGKPIIFAGNHSMPYDFPILTKATKRRSYVFVGRQNLPLVDQIFFALNDVMYADRKNKREIVAAKGTLLKCLSLGQSVAWFPEGTWNLTPNLLISPLPPKRQLPNPNCRGSAAAI